MHMIEDNEAVLSALNEVEKRNEIRKFIESGMSVSAVVELLKYQGEVILLLFTALASWEREDGNEDFFTPILELYNRLQNEGLEIEKFEAITLKDSIEESLEVEEAVDQVIAELKSTYISESKYQKKADESLGAGFSYISILENMTEEAKVKLPALMLATQLSLVLRDCFKNS